MNVLFDILKESKADDFIIRQTNTQSQEVFFVGKKLDMGRVKNVTHTQVTVYVDSDDKAFRGSATKEIHPTSTKEEMEKEIEKAIFAASFVKNPWFPVVENVVSGHQEQKLDLSKELMKITKAMLEVKAGEHEKLNSFEIFVNKKNTHIINSKGVDVSFPGFDCEIEAVINAEKEGHEIELIKVFHFADKSAEEITRDVEEMFENGKARLEAVPTKQNEHATVLLTGDDVPEFFSYFEAHTDANNQYMQVAKAKLDEKMTGEDADSLCITTKAVLNGSTYSKPFDMDGNAVKDISLFEDGVCKSYWGSVQHAHYMQMKETTSINNVIVSGGSMSLDEMKNLPHLEITDFSAFVMDPISGNFGGEIRLGYESDGKNMHPVTGGSLSANYSNILKNIKFSKETRQINNYIVPCAVLLQDVVVAGE